MKNYFLVLLVVCTVSFAQDKPKFGLNLGGTYANLRNNNLNVGDESIFFGKNRYDLNFLVGISVEVPLNEQFSFIANINYERKTFYKKYIFRLTEFDDFDPVIGNGEHVTFTYKTRLEYLTIPLNLKYYIDTKKSYYVNGGPFMGLFLNSKYKTNGSDSGDGNDNFKTLDFGVNLGVGTCFKLNDKNNLNLEIRHNYGLADINNIKNTPTFTSNISYAKTNSFNLIANWQFSL